MLQSLLNSLLQGDFFLRIPLRYLLRSLSYIFLSNFLFNFLWSLTYNRFLVSLSCYALRCLSYGQRFSFDYHLQRYRMRSVLRDFCLLLCLYGSSSGSPRRELNLSIRCTS